MIRINNNDDVIKENKLSVPIPVNVNRYDKISVILPYEKKDNNIIDLQNQFQFQMKTIEKTVVLSLQSMKQKKQLKVKLKVGFYFSWHKFKKKQDEN